MRRCIETSLQNLAFPFLVGVGAGSAEPRLCKYERTKS